MVLSTVKRLKLSLQIAIILGVICGIGRVLLLYLLENYTPEEVHITVINLMQSGVNFMLLSAILLGVLFFVVWSFYKDLEGLILAGLVTGLLIFPLAYYVNKNLLPGFKEIESLIGNGLFAVAAFLMMFFIQRKWTHRVQFVSKICKRVLLLSALGVAFGINILFFLQPEQVKLQAVSAAPVDLIELFDRSQIERLLKASDDSFGNPVSARELLGTFFSRKTALRFQNLRKRIAEHDSAHIIANADSIIQRKVAFVGVSRKLPDNIDWKTNPTDDRVWIFALNRHEWLWDLAAAFFLTRDAKYALTFEDIALDWLEDNPVLSWKNESTPPWRLIETSLRLTSCWLDAFDIFYTSEAISEPFKWRMLASLHEHAQFLLHFRSPGRNHLLQETFGLLAVAGAFPEFKMSQRWLEIANHRLNRILHTEIYPDGGYNEGSTFYHRFVIRILQQIADFAQENQVELSDYFYEQLEKMYEFLLYVARPDGVMPQVNDGFHAKDLRILFEKPAAAFARADFDYFVSERQNGTPPQQKSFAFPYTGLYVMRSDWGADARYLLVDGGLFGSAHGHEDKLSFEMHAFGKPFVIESGTYTYNYNRWHRYFESSFAHNTIVVDRRSQLRQPYPQQWASDPPQKQPNIWLSQEHFDYFEGIYQDGYGNQKEAVLNNIEHVRRILFVKPDYWILWDVVKGMGKVPVNQLFHMPTEVTVKIIDDDDVLVSYPDGPHVLIKSLSQAGFVPRIVEGSESPIQGWVSPKYGFKTSAPVVDFQQTGELPLVFVAVLFPYRNLDTRKRMNAELAPALIGNQPAAVSEALWLRIESDISSDEILLAPYISGNKTLAGLTTPAQIVLLRRYQDGTIVKSEQTALVSEKAR
ncbi:MAG: heparinase II/III family protein, partial [bacterium]